MTHDNLLTKACNYIIRGFAVLLLGAMLWLPASAKNLKPFITDYEWGYVDENGTVIDIGPYEAAGEFVNGFAAVKQWEKWGFINEECKLVVPFKYYDCRDFSDGMAAVMEVGKWGYINEKGEVVIPLKYDDASYFSEGLACVRCGMYWGVIDKSGKMIIEPKFTSNSFYSEGLMANFDPQSQLNCYFDKTGKAVLYSYYSIMPFTEGLAGVQAENNKWGYISHDFISGNTHDMTIAPQFDRVEMFSEGRAVVMTGNIWGVIDHTGKLLTSKDYDIISNYSDGMAACLRNGKYGYLDLEGNEVIKPQFYYADYFDKGLAKVTSVTGDRFYIDKQGRRYATEQDARRFLAQEAAGGASDGVQTADTRPFAEVARNYAETFVDVDTDIPQSGVENGNIYALVIANERYDETAPVAHAANDGAVVKAYLTKAFGVPEENIVTVTDGTAVQMDRAIKRLKTKTEAAATVGKKFSVIAYYSGHGMPSSDTQDSYLLPTDVAPMEPRPYSISLNDLYRRLGDLKAEYVAVFLDACFTGNSRSDEALDAGMKGIMFEPKAGTPHGNMVVFSACEGNQTAYAYDKGRHGIFTYWLLRTLKETRGQVSLGELYERLTRYVPFTATSLDKTQTPCETSSPNFSWRSIRLR